MIKLERGQEMGRQHMLQFRLNDKQWEEIMQIRKEHCFDNNGQLYKFLFFNAMLGVQREKNWKSYKKSIKRLIMLLKKDKKLTLIKRTKKND